MSLFQPEMHLRTLHQINARNIHVAENFHFIMQPTCSGVLGGENYLSVATIFEAWSKIWIHDSIYVLTIIWVLNILADKYVEI